MKRRAIRILHLDDDPVDSDRIKSTLELEGFLARSSGGHLRDFLAKQNGNAHDIVISEVSAASFHGSTRWRRRTGCALHLCLQALGES